MNDTNPITEASADRWVHRGDTYYLVDSTGQIRATLTRAQFLHDTYRDGAHAEYIDLESAKRGAEERVKWTPKH